MNRRITLRIVAALYVIGSVPMPGYLTPQGILILVIVESASSKHIFDRCDATFPALGDAVDVLVCACGGR